MWSAPLKKKSWRTRKPKATAVWYLIILLMEEILHQLIGNLSHYLQGFIHPRWLAGFLNHQQCLYKIIYYREIPEILLNSTESIQIIWVQNPSVEFVWNECLGKWITLSIHRFSVKFLVKFVGFSTWFKRFPVANHVKGFPVANHDSTGFCQTKQ